MAQVIEIFADTGEVIERDFTPEELAQREADAAAYAFVQTKEEAESVAKNQARAAAIAHAKSLGFTDEMIAVMYPNL